MTGFAGGFAAEINLSCKIGVMTLAGWVVLIAVIVVLLIWLAREHPFAGEFEDPVARAPRRARGEVEGGESEAASSADSRLVQAAAEALATEGNPNDNTESSTDTFSAERRAAPAGASEEEEDATNEASVPLETPQPFRGGNGQYGRKEEVCRQVLEEIYGLPFPKVRPDFLKNRRTGRNLELDGYCHAVRVGFEFNGAQHYAYPNIFHKNSQEFMRQVQRDNYKYKLCKRLGIHLIVIPHDVPAGQIRDFITAQLPQKGRGVIYVNPKSSNP